MSASQEIEDGKRFEFGANWADEGLPATAGDSG